MTTNYPTPTELRDLAKDLEDGATRTGLYVIGLRNWANKIEGGAPAPVPDPVPPAPSSAKPTPLIVRRPPANANVITLPTSPATVLGSGDVMKDVVINGYPTIDFQGGSMERVWFLGSATVKGLINDASRDVWCDGQLQIYPDPGDTDYDFTLVRWGALHGNSDGRQFVRRWYKDAPLEKCYTGRVTINILGGYVSQDGTPYIQLANGDFPHGDCDQWIGANEIYYGSDPDSGAGPVADMGTGDAPAWETVNGVTRQIAGFGRSSAVRFESFGINGEVEKVETHNFWINGGAFAFPQKYTDPVATAANVKHYDTHFGPETMARRSFQYAVGAGELIRPTDWALKPI